MVLVDHQQLQHQLPLGIRKKIYIFMPGVCFFSEFSRTTRTTVSPSKAPTHTDFPITVLYEEKTGKSTPFHLVLKPNTKIAEVCFSFINKKKLIYQI